MPVDTAHDHLRERPCQLILLPRRGLFAGTQADDDIADSRRLPRL